MKKATVGWLDLTVPNAEQVRDFYSSVVGWKPEPVSMGDYDDFNMTHPETGEPVAGVCHARGPNEGLPPVWMVYFIVEDLGPALDAVEAAGGRVLRRPATLSDEGGMAVIEDPAGACSALFQPAKQ